MWKSHQKCRSFSQALHKHGFSESVRIFTQGSAGWCSQRTDRFYFRWAERWWRFFIANGAKNMETRKTFLVFGGLRGVNYPGVNWLGVTIGVEVSLWLIKKTWSMTSWHHEFIVEWSGYPQEWLTAIIRHHIQLSFMIQRYMKWTHQWLETQGWMTIWGLH